MHVDLTRPELRKFIDDEVRAGHFPSAQAAIETAVAQMMLEHGDLDEVTVQAIAAADSQYADGKYVEWQDVREDLRSRYTGK